MAFLKVQIKPGIFRDGTNYSASGSWYDCDKIRFRNGAPESIGGWQKAISTAIVGTARSMHAWVDLSGTQYAAIGTHKKLLVFNTGTIADITPIRATASLTDPFGTTSGLQEIVVTDTAHGAAVGDYVVFSGASTFNGIAAATLNAEHVITDVPTVDTYKITVSDTANATSSGGGTVTATYYLGTGLDSTITGTGWGAGTWGRGTWGSSASTSAEGSSLRLWTLDNWGEDLVACPRSGAIYNWAVGDANATLLSSESGADSVPQYATEICVTAERHLVAFGCSPTTSSALDPLTVRWSSSEDNLSWLPLSTNTAGEQRLAGGSQIVTHAKTSQEILIWTDSSVQSMSFVGPPYIYGFKTVAPHTTIMGPNAKVAVNDIVYWMGASKFYRYSGRVEPLSCTVEEYIFSNINTSQRFKIICCSNHSENEIIWFYPSAGSSENDRYVIYNYAEDVWYYGQLSRTAWMDRGLFRYPMAVGDNYLYYHEYGVDDGSTNPATAIASYIESAPVELENGDKFMHVSKVLPDVTFRSSSSVNPTVTMQLTPRDYQASVLGTPKSGDTVRSATVPVEVHTDDIDIRLRGRSMIIKVSANQVGTEWRLGIPRLNVRSDGQKT